MGTIAAMLSVFTVLGVTYGTEVEHYDQPTAIEVAVHEFQFSAPAVDESLPEQHSSIRVYMRPPHWDWEVSRNVYGCSQETPEFVSINQAGTILRDVPGETTRTPDQVAPFVLDLPPRPVLTCRTDMPVEWGCAWMRIGVTQSWEDPNEEVISTPFGAYQPRTSWHAFDRVSSAVLIGTCPDPPLPVIYMPEPGMSLALFSSLLLLGSLASYRARARRTFPT